MESDCLRPLCPFESSGNFIAHVYTKPHIVPEEPAESLSFLGPMLEKQCARALVSGKLDPRSLEAAPTPSALPARLLRVAASAPSPPPAQAALVKANPMLKLAAARLMDACPILSVQQSPQQQRQQSSSLLSSMRRRFGAERRPPPQCVSLSNGARNPFKRRPMQSEHDLIDEVEVDDVASLSSLVASDPSIAEVAAGDEVQLLQLSASDIESDEVRTFADSVAPPAAKAPPTARAPPRKVLLTRPRHKRRRKSGAVQRPITSFFAKRT